MTVKTLSLTEVTSMTPQQYLRLTQGQRPLLIDVRTPLEYRSGHAPGARNLSLDRILLGMIPFLRRWLWPTWLQELPKDQPLAVICLTSHRSPLAATELVKAGFTQVFNISGGMQAWQHSGLPIHKGPLD